MNNTNITRLAVAAANAGPALAKLKKATQDVEAIFVKDLMAAMRRTVPHESMGSQFGSEMYQDMFDQALAQSGARSGSLGIGKTIYRQLAPAALRAATAEALRQASGSHRAAAKEAPKAGQDAQTNVNNALQEKKA